MLDRLFQPASVAVIGASNDPRKWGYIVTKRILDGGFPGRIYPVNPKGGQVLGLQCYPSVRDVEGPVDLAVIGIRNTFVPGAVRDCVQKGVRAIIINTAGFGETGPEGQRLEREVVELARQGGARVVGPNCLGVWSARARLNTTIIPDIIPGNIGVLSQSGNMGIMLFELAASRGLGFSVYVGVGNQADLQFHEYLEYLGDDDTTRVIVLYVEGFGTGREFLHVASRVSQKKPIVALKAGRSQSGRKSAASHTGSLATSDRVCDAALREAGIVRVQRADELFPVVEALLKAPLPSGNRVAFVTDGGAFAVLTADAAEDHGLRLSEYSPHTKAKLREVLPPHASPENNPLDTAGGMDDHPYLFAECADALLGDEQVDALMFVGLLGGYDRLFWPGHAGEEVKTAEEVCRLAARHGKPVLIQTVYSDPGNHCVRVFREAGIPVYFSLEHAVAAMSGLIRYAEFRGAARAAGLLRPSSGARRQRVEEVLRRARAEQRAVLLEPEASDVLLSYGVPFPRFGVARSTEEAVELARMLGYPVVMKIVSPDVVHKSEVGGVRLDLRTEEEVRAAFSEIVSLSHRRGVRTEGVMIAQYVRGGVEVVVGLTRDPTFGPVVMFGLGGVFVEALQDVAFRVAPVDRSEARAMIEEVRGYTVLAGFRGLGPRDVDSLADLIVAVGDAGMENAEIASIDLNPVLVLEQGVLAVDSRVILETNPAGRYELDDN